MLLARRIFYLVVQWNIQGNEKSASEQVVGGVYWVTRIEWNFDLRPNALYRIGCDRCIDMTAILTARQYWVV